MAGPVSIRHKRVKRLGAMFARMHGSVFLPLITGNVH
jgi:hypothetical protein